ncbi:MAG TPA: hypothetical protein EYP10_02485, partial [Armatimonadetes bacterium]|nr:hypothetical protein [Armatimonadota bacterium]
VKPLIALLKERDADVEHVMWILSALKSSHALELLIKLLRDRSAIVRARAVYTLGRLRDAKAVEPLIAALNDKSATVRRMVVLALKEISDERALKPLQQLLRTEKVASVRAAIQEAIPELLRGTGIVAYWNFEDVRGGIVKDITGGGNDGTLNGGKQVKGKIGFAIEFNGKSDYVDFNRPRAIKIANKPLTIMAWVYPKGKDGVIVAYGGAWCGFSLYVKDGVAKFGIHRRREGPGYIVASDKSIIGTWTHLAGVVKEDCIELYVNGELASRKRIPGLIPSNPGQGLQVGFDAGNSPAEITDYFEGIIDEVKIFTRALSPKEIVAQSKATL